MTEAGQLPLNIICLATYFKGVDFIRECQEHGACVFLITKEKMLGEDWPRDALEDLVAVPDDAGPDLFIDLVSMIARKAKPDRVIALEEFDVITAALVREHLYMPGMSNATAKTFRDKLAMRFQAQGAGLEVPEFVPLLSYEEINEFISRVPPPWVMKPRSDVSAIGIRKLDEPEQVWRAIEELDARERLRERASYYLLERFVAGEVFHVDSLVESGRVAFAGVNRYGRPPMEVAHQGGVYISHTVQRRSEDERRLLEINRRLIKAMRLETGATHAEFIKSAENGQFYFLEIAARVGGAYIAEVLKAASGINLWREWARMETRAGNHPRLRLRPRKNYAGIVLSLARQEWPDTSAYDDSEIVYRVKKHHHAGLIVSSAKLERVTELLDDYARRFVDDFIAVLPPPERPG